MISGKLLLGMTINQTVTVEGGWYVGIIGYTERNGSVKSVRVQRAYFISTSGEVEYIGDGDFQIRTDPPNDPYNYSKICFSENRTLAIKTLKTGYKPVQFNIQVIYPDASHGSQQVLTALYGNYNFLLFNENEKSVQPYKLDLGGNLLAYISHDENTMLVIGTDKFVIMDIK